jgi:hypothetical protein
VFLCSGLRRTADADEGQREEQILRALSLAESGTEMAEICREYGINCQSMRNVEAIVGCDPQLTKAALYLVWNGYFDLRR